MRGESGKSCSGFYVKRSWVRVELGVYWFWAALRIALTLVPQFGYIHPDEYFQTTEVAAGDVFKMEVSLPWEFNRSFPIRSIPLIYATMHLPLSIAKLFFELIAMYLGFNVLSSYFLIVTQRLAMCVVSFISDYCLFQICYLYGQNYKERLIVFASSYVSLVFMTRTFTNTIELALFNILLYLVATCMAESEKINYQSGYLENKYKEAETIADQVKINKLIKLLPKHSLKRCMRITCVTVAGFFNRPTFLLYAVVPLFYWFQRGVSSKSSFLRDFHTRILLFIVYCCPVFCYFVFCDSVYYGYLTWGEVLTYRVNFNNFVLTPLNFIKYNFDPDNTGKHGLHPKFLHVLVNVPLLFNVLGLSALVVVFKMLYRGSFSHWTLLPRSQSITGMMTLSFIAPLIGLSVFNHQEPRFIIPILLPLVFLYSHLLVDFQEDCATVAPFRKRHPIRRKTRGFLRLPFKCINYIEKATEEFDNRFNIYGRELSNLKNDVATLNENGVGETRETPKPKTHEPADPRRHRSVLIKLWYLSNLICVLFFGFLHQGGVYPLCRYFHDELQVKPRYTTYHLVTSHVYSIPRHLLNIRSEYRTSNSHLQAYELGSDHMENIHTKIIQVLKAAEAMKQTRRKYYRVYYAFPRTKLNEFEFTHSFYKANYTYRVERVFYPHFSSEALPNLNLNVTAIGFNFNADSLWFELTQFFPIKYLNEFSNQFGLMLVTCKLNH